MNSISTKKQLSTILKYLPDPVFIMNQEGKYLAIYGGSDTRYYHDGSGLIGLYVHDVLDKDKANWFLKKINTAINKKTVINFEYSLEAVDVDGLHNEVGPSSEIYFEARVQALPEPFKKETAIVWSARNITQRKNLEMQLRVLSERDTLTGLYNRRKLLEVLEAALKQTTKMITLLMFDIDFLKKINDTHGHTVGDKVLKLLSQVVQKQISKSDVFARIGGDEFMIFIKDTSKKLASEVAEKIRNSVEKTDFTVCGCETKITISIGLIQVNNNNQQVEDLFHRVDSALYKAKNKGRNQVVIES